MSSSGVLIAERNRTIESAPRSPRERGIEACTTVKTTMVLRVKSGNRFPSRARSPGTAPKRRKSSWIPSAGSPPRARFQAKPARRAASPRARERRVPGRFESITGSPHTVCRRSTQSFPVRPPRARGSAGGEGPPPPRPLRQIHFAVVPQIGVLEIEELLVRRFGLDANHELVSRPPNLLSRDE